MNRVLDCYYPGKQFPSVSTTGRSCSLSCKHCSGRYLEGMVPATDPEELLSFARALSKAGGEGFLLSGGSDGTGRVRLERFVPAIKEIKATTTLRINAHIGLTPPEGLGDLVDSGIDAFSVDIYGDDETVKEVLGIDAKAKDYVAVVKGLMDSGAPVVAPHLCIGLRSGTLGGEMSALRLLEPISPATLVLISFIPTKGTAYESCPPPNGKDIVSVIRSARSILPHTRLLLGCMRSRRDRAWEPEAVLAGLDGIVLPSTETVKMVSTLGYTIAKKDICCALG